MSYTYKSSAIRRQGNQGLLDESTRCAVNQILKSVVREICTLRSVGVGAPIG
ncbi:MAG: hypothetical protein HY882_04030 [Deltaproteobacteria bacterium]|nr:hypothetical protein [Deltaproteobacteria bacterium]